MKASLYKNYLLVLLMVILAFNYIDRIALSVVLQEIKVDLHLSDAQLGLLTGIAFAFFYAIMGIPIARWADRGNRTTIITVTTALWSVMVALCGRAGSFLQLLLLRVGVGVGESGCWPPANSLIPDYFPRAERPRAVGIYVMGASFSSLIGFFMAGWLNELFGWRMMFLLIGLPGLGLAVLARLTIREPRLRTTGAGAIKPVASSQESACAGQGADVVRAESAQACSETPHEDAVNTHPGIGEVLRTLWGNVTFRHLFVEFCVVYFFGYGLMQWTPTFFIRSYGFTTGQVGTWLAIAYGLSGVIGTYAGGILATRFLAHQERRQFTIIAILFCFMPIMWIATYLSPDPYVALTLLFISILVGATINGPLFAAIQSLVPPRMRAMAIAVLFLFANLIGLGLGPLAAGLISDALHPRFGVNSLRYALVALCPGYFWAAWHLWRATRTVERDMEAVRHLDETPHTGDPGPQAPDSPSSLQSTAQGMLGN